MKHLIIFILIFLSVKISRGSDSLSVSQKPAKNIVKTELIGLLFYSIKSIIYERVIDSKFSIQINYASGEYMVGNENAEFNLGNKTGAAFPNTREKIQIKQYMKGELRYYLSHNRTRIPAGFHIGGSLAFNKQTESFYNDPDPNNQFGTLNSNISQTIIAFNFGPQLLIKRIISLDISASPGLTLVSGTEERKYGISNQFGETNDLSSGGLSISFSFSLGIAFGK
jgi:hypothetical protein